VTGSYAQSAGTGTGAVVNPFQTIERKDVGLTLKIKPQVSEGGLLKLDIYQEISSIARTAVSGASDLVTNKRSIETKVIVDDGQTLVLGGLIEDNRNESEQAVPGLGKLPLVGWLFRYREKTGRRTNLMIFLRPVIIYGPNDSYRVTADRYDYLRAQGRDIKRDQMMNRLAPAQPGAQPGKDADPRRNDDPRAPVAGETPPPAPSTGN
jgi:general secretion pathway protein D